MTLQNIPPLLLPPKYDDLRGPIQDWLRQILHDHEEAASTHTTVIEQVAGDILITQSVDLEWDGTENPPTYQTTDFVIPCVSGKRYYIETLMLFAPADDDEDLRFEWDLPSSGTFPSTEAGLLWTYGTTDNRNVIPIQADWEYYRILGMQTSNELRAHSSASYDLTAYKQFGVYDPTADGDATMKIRPDVYTASEHPTTFLAGSALRYREVDIPTP